jgi:hypothetical protein
MNIIKPEDEYKTNLFTAINTVSTIAKTCLVPILCSEDRHTFDVIGSSVLVEFNENKYLISAAHVFKNENLIYYFPGIQNLVPLLGPSIQMTSNFKEDRHDIKIISISDKLFEEFKTFNPIKVRESDAKRILEPETNVVLFGFPNSRNRKFRRYIKKFSIQALTNTTADNNWYILEGYDTSLHILIHYNKRINFTADNIQVDFPDPHGISGGGIWKLFLQKNYLNSKNNYLVGIVIEKSKNHKFIVGIKLEYVIKALLELEKRIKNI